MNECHRLQFSAPVDSVQSSCWVHSGCTVLDTLGTSYFGESSSTGRPVYARGTIDCIFRSTVLRYSVYQCRILDPVGEEPSVLCLFCRRTRQVSPRCAVALPGPLKPSRAGERPVTDPRNPPRSTSPTTKQEQYSWTLQVSTVYSIQKVVSDFNQTVFVTRHWPCADQFP